MELNDQYLPLWRLFESNVLEVDVEMKLDSMIYQ